MKRSLLSACILLCLFAFTAWGPVGHRTVATIAQNHLTPNARTAIGKILGDTSLADISTWADDVRSASPAFAYTAPWHYLNLPSGYNYAQFVEAVTNNQSPNVYSALLKCEADLKSDTTSALYRGIALKFVVHLVGDIHQPMHVSHANDQGGNLVNVTFNGVLTNLHSLWDSGLLRRQPQTVDMLVTDFDNATPDQITRWQNDSLMKWAYESYLISQQIYVDAGKNPRFTDDYYRTAMPIVQKRILQGGIRLAGVLNEIYK